MTGLVAPGVSVGWSKAEPFGFSELVDSVRELSVTRETDLVLCAGLREGLALRKILPFGLQKAFQLSYA